MPPAVPPSRRPAVPRRHAQAPSYARVTEINTHPLVTHPYIELPPCSAREEKDILLRVQNHMVDSYDYVRCSDVATDWKVWCGGFRDLSDFWLSEALLDSLFSCCVDLPIAFTVYRCVGAWLIPGGGGAWI